jgi:hypothetical protein
MNMNATVDVVVVVATKDRADNDRHHARRSVIDARGGQRQGQRRSFRFTFRSTSTVADAA